MATRTPAPVRIGNAAAEHIQLDVFGEVIISIHSLLLLRGAIRQETWNLVERLAETVMRNWHRKDRGVWEVRGEQQHFVYSKVMCWARPGLCRLHRRGHRTPEPVPPLVPGRRQHQDRNPRNGLERR